MLPTAIAPDSLILARRDIAAIARPGDYIEALADAFRDGTVHGLPVAHVPGHGGGFHIKAAVGAAPPWGVIKINGNFPGNPQTNGLPTIQGCLLLVDLRAGCLLAVMDSSEITAQRTAAASALAARYLARRSSKSLALIGCGLQARYHLDALLALQMFELRRLRCIDSDPARADALAHAALARGLQAQVSADVAAACRDADIIVTSTPAARPLLRRDQVAPGAFIAAVGADNPGKNEIEPALLAAACVVPDSTAQAASMGDLRAAIEAGVMAADDVHAELADIVAGRRPGRSDEHQVVIFDSTGIAIEDHAAACMVYRKAQTLGDAVMRVGFGRPVT